MNADMKWANSFLDKIESKLYASADVIGANFPNIAVNGKYKDLDKFSPFGWTNGFWPGLMWLMYLETKKDKYREIAEECERKMDEAFLRFENLYHDVGFMWQPVAVTNYKITGNIESQNRGLRAAIVLAGRFNPQANFIRAWSDWNDPEGNIRRAIVDCMMNLPLLYWASEETKDPRFKAIAMLHADTTMKHFVRPDGSCEHMVVFDLETGEPMEKPRGQGYSENSSWSRGQSWAVYGFVLSYIHTQKVEYLDTAKRVANYFIANLDEDGIPALDFRAPEEPAYKDASAGAITACGLLELAKIVPENEKKFYFNAAVKILKGLEGCCDFDKNTQSILQKSSTMYHTKGGGIHVSLIYGDYYLTEALLKIKGNEFQVW